MQVYTTNNVDYDRRLGYWSALNSDAFAPMNISARRSATFQGCLWLDRLGSVNIGRASSSAVVIRRTGADVGRLTERAFVLTMSEEASYTVRTKGNECVVHGGALVLSDTTQVYDLQHAGCSVIILRIQEDVLKAYLPAADDLTGLVLKGDRGAGLHASTMMRSVLRTVRQGLAEGIREHLAAALLHTVAAAFSEAYRARDTSPMTAELRRFQLTRFVDTHLRDADLTVQKVATAFGLSDRYVRMLFETVGESLSCYIQRRRLEESARQLRDPLWQGKTVSEIAFAWGFNSLGSYDRAFKARFDLTPRQYRQRLISSN
jgi:AraC-like DNA-binding protein